MKKIYVEPFGGLANRMRTVASAISLAQELNRQTLVIWDNNKDLNCSFEELFKPIDNVKIIKKVKWHAQVRSSYHKGKLKSIVINIVNRFLGIDHCIVEQDFLKMEWEDKLNLRARLTDKKNIYIRTCQEFSNGKKLIRLFIPTEKIQSTLNVLLKSFNANTYGIHIRRTDNEKSIKYSPLRLFIDEIDCSVKNVPDVKFYLATDDPETEAILKNKFEDRIITVPQKNLERNNSDGIKAALTDLLLLANTKKILGSYWSSFSSVAALINNIPLKILKKDF